MIRNHESDNLQTYLKQTREVSIVTYPNQKAHYQPRDKAQASMLSRDRSPQQRYLPTVDSFRPAVGYTTSTERWFMIRSDTIQ